MWMKNMAGSLVAQLGSLDCSRTCHQGQSLVGSRQPSLNASVSHSLKAWWACE